MPTKLFTNVLHVDTMARINRTNQETADNLTNRRITRSMVRQGLGQL